MVKCLSLFLKKGNLMCRQEKGRIYIYLQEYQSAWRYYQFISSCILCFQKSNSLTILWTESEEFQEPTESNWDSTEKSGMCFGNRTQRTSNSPFSGEIRLSHWSPRKTWETQFSQCFPYVSVLLVCGILRFCESQCLSSELGRTVGLRWRPSELLWIRMVG